MEYIFLGVMVVFILLITTMAYKVVQQGHHVVVERLGAYYKTLPPGLHFIMPFIDRKKATVFVGEQVVKFDSISCVTENDRKAAFSVDMYYRVQVAKLYVYGVADPMRALQTITTDRLKNIILKYESQNVNKNIEHIQEELQETLSDQVAAWGISIIRVNIEKLIN